MNFAYNQNIEFKEGPGQKKVQNDLKKYKTAII